MIYSLFSLVLLNLHSQIRAKSGKDGIFSSSFSKFFPLLIVLLELETQLKTHLSLLFSAKIGFFIIDEATSIL